MKVNKVEVNRYQAKSRIEGIDFVINPYVGCPNGCMYCYAGFMKHLTKHEEKWGSFVDVKKSDYVLKKVSVENKTYLISSITDCYNKYEEKYQITRGILEQLVKFKFSLIIETKNSLILRDLDILKQMHDVKVVISLNTLDDKFRKGIEKYSSIESRLNTLKELNKNGIYTILNISPVFPYLSDYQKIIEETKDYVKEYKFEFLKLNNNQVKREVLKYIREKHSKYYLEYAKIYLLDNSNYFDNLKLEIEKFCQDNKIKYHF